jgi:predicted Zn finger-like uncharacterized protein
MSAPKLTRCPGCGTVFRVTAAQLSLREGQVRCGHCRAVFDANDHFVSVEIHGADEFGADDELIRGRPTVTLRSADALLPVVPAAPPTPPAEQRPASGQTEAPPAERNADEIPAVPQRVVESPAGERATDEATAAAAEGPAEDGAAAQAPAREGTAAEPSAGKGAAAAESADGGAAGDGAAADGATGERPGGEGTAGVDAAAMSPPDTTEPGVPADAAAPVVPPDETSPAVPAAVDVAPNDAAATLPAVPAPLDVGNAASPPRFEWKKRKDTSGPPKRIYAVAIVVLAAAILVQLVLEFRDTLAARVPATRAPLSAACRVLSCTIEPLRDTAALSIDASDLQADPAHRGLLVLSATIRNRAAYPIAYPYLELTLTDSSEQIVVRRAFAPQDYAGGTADFHAGIAVNGERLVKLFIDASATQQAGYQLYLFYP